MAKYVLLDDEAPAGKKGGYVLLEDAPEKPLVEQIGGVLNTAITQAPRQAGLTARYALEGVGDTLDFVSSPIRALQNAVMPNNLQAKTGALSGVADYLGLPKPENSTERVVGDVSKLLVSGGGMIGGANKVAQLTKAGGVAQKTAQALAAKPTQQALSAAGAGFGGGSVREAGGDDTAQLIGSLIGGVGVPMTEDFAVRASKAVGKKFGDTLQQFKPAQAGQVADAIGNKINQVLQQSGVTLNDFTPQVQKEMRGMVDKAVNVGGGLDVDALRRLADYRLIGATPTRASLTLNPVDITQQKNLAKVGVNTSNENLQRLGMIENQNNQSLISSLNDLGAGAATDKYGAGETIADTLMRRNRRANELIGGRYDKARNTQGRSALLDPSTFTNQANDSLEQALLQSKLPTDVRNLMNKVSLGEIPLTVDVAEQLKTRIGDLQRASADKSERMALGLVRNSLDNTPLSSGQGQEALDAFGRARKLNRAYMGIVEKTPALQAVRDGVEPDKFVQQFITGDSKNASLSAQQALKRSIKGNPDAVQAVRQQIADALKKAGTNQSADEVGNFGNSAYNKMLGQIGDRKLSVWFTPQEVAQFKATGRVAAYEQFHPRGSAVNNSNTASAGGLMSKAMNTAQGLGDSFFMTKPVLDVGRNVIAGQQAKKALSLADALMLQKQRQSSPIGAAMMPLMLSNQRQD